MAVLSGRGMFHILKKCQFHQQCMSILVALNLNQHLGVVFFSVL